MLNIRRRLIQFDPMKKAIIDPFNSYTYGHLVKMIDMISKTRYKPGQIVSIVGDYCMFNIAKLFALSDAGAIAVPMATLRTPSYWNTSHAHYTALRKRHVPGLVLFTSGSSGVPKIAVHDFSKMLDKFDNEAHPEVGKIQPRTIVSFLGFDHIGGINTLLSTILTGGTLVVPGSRDAQEVARIIDHYKVDVLPTTPTFLRMLLMKTDEYFPHLKLITYGTEPMDDLLLNACTERWPHVKFKQTYGLTETGILRTKSLGDDDLYFKIDVPWRVVDGMLEIKTETTMLGYLNAPSPITDDGWYRTGDCVEVSPNGEYIMIIGRKSEFINVGGEKVHPTEIERGISLLVKVEDCRVEAEANPILGQIIKATVKPAEKDVDHDTFAKDIKLLMKNTGWPRWKIPQKIIVTDENLHTDRYKKKRV